MVESGGKNSGALPGDAIEKVLPYMNGFHNNIDFIKKGVEGIVNLQRIQRNVLQTHKRKKVKQTNNPRIKKKNLIMFLYFKKKEK